MILGLVLATLDQLPTPEESILDPRPVLTPLSLRHFPSVTYEDARAKFGQGPRRRLLPKPENPRVPPLTELLLDFCRLNPAATQTRKNRSVLKARNMWKAYKANAPFYHHYEEEPFEDARTSRKPKDGKGPRTMYLSAATLVLVPPNLMNQWANEMNKHCKSGLRRYIATEEKLPPARQLASYDVRKCGNLCSTCGPLMPSYRSFSSAILVSVASALVAGSESDERCRPIPGGK